MKINKCEPGYISNQKKKNSLLLLMWVAIGIAIFIGGYMFLHTRANIFTVLAVLMVLPGAKRIVALVVFLKKKGVTNEQFEAVSNKTRGLVLTDYVFTSTERVMHLDFVVIENDYVYAKMSDTTKQDVEHMKKYFTDSVHGVGDFYKVKFVDTQNSLEKNIGKDIVEDFSEKNKELFDLLRTLAV